MARSGCANKDQGSLDKTWSRKCNPRHRSLALSTTMINIIIPQIITQIEIIIPACWFGPCATAQCCAMGKGAGGFIHQEAPEGGSEKGESGGEAARGQVLGDRAAAAYECKRKPKLPSLSGCR